MATEEALVAEIDRFFVCRPAGGGRGLPATQSGPAEAATPDPQPFIAQRDEEAVVWLVGVFRLGGVARERV
eukprot:9399898-Lingulodinium_polyedra.AAC.1